MNDTITLSSKYQLVIPKAARQKLGLQNKPNQKMRIKHLTKDEITLVKVQPVGQYFGSLKGAWGSKPTAALRNMRDQEWH